jgi:glycosyltransferase involved in cell wall biosynthesis
VKSHHGKTSESDLKEQISVVVTTYNRMDALNAVLRGFARQNDRGFEVIIADDGSNPPARDVMHAGAARFDFPIKYVWHTDRGFRAGEIRNRAILASRGSYCIFLDGDCIPRPNFIAAHRRLAEPGWFVAGNRVLLSREFTRGVLAEGAEPAVWTLRTWLALRWQQSINRVGPLWSLPLGPLRKVRPAAWRGARSCNLAIWRSDLDRVDGFDATYNGWGLEDSDLLIRLLRTGVRRKDGNFATGVIHLWHPESDRSSLVENQRRLDEIERAGRVRAIRGLSRLDPAAEMAV